jgi:hypothetical protein
MNGVKERKLDSKEEKTPWASWTWLSNEGYLAAKQEMSPPAQASDAVWRRQLEIKQYTMHTWRHT